MNGPARTEDLREVAPAPCFVVSEGTGPIGGERTLKDWKRYCDYTGVTGVSHKKNFLTLYLFRIIIYFPAFGIIDP